MVIQIGRALYLLPTGTLVNVGSGRCMDSPYGNTANGTQLQIYDCNNSGAQTFSYNGGASNIIGPAGKCVDVAGDDIGGDGAAVQLWDCQDWARDQNWTWNGSSLTTMGMCLDIAGGGTGNGTPLQLRNCNRQPGAGLDRQPQRHTVQPAIGPMHRLPRRKHRQRHAAPQPRPSPRPEQPVPGGVHNGHRRGVDGVRTLR